MHFSVGRHIVTTASAAMLLGALSACGTMESAADTYSDYTCADLADEAVSISEGQDVELVKVRSPKIVKDHRDDVTVPKGDGDALVLSCRGTGVWSDGGPTSQVKLELTVDADKELFVRYQEA